MVDPIVLRRWLYRALFVGLWLCITFVHILPVDVGAQHLPGPDILLCITFAWVLRRPQYVPPLLVAAVFLVSDLLAMRPPGLWAGIVVIALEFLRAREHSSRDQSLPFEWAMVAIVMMATTLAYRMVIAIFMLDQVSFGMTLSQLVFTILAYPVVVMFSRYVFGLRKIVPGEVDQYGHAL